MVCRSITCGSSITSIPPSEAATGYSCLNRHLLNRPMYKELRTISFEAWHRASMAA